MSSDDRMRDVEDGRNGKRDSTNQDFPSSRANEDEDGQHAEQTEGADADSSARPTKKAKRAKYISRACTSCQHRKIKCDGGDPCAPCAAKHRICTSTSRARGQHRQDPERGAGNSPQSSYSALSDQVLSRLATVERELRKINQSSSERTQPPRFHRRPSDEDPANSKSDADIQRTLELESQTFAGEVSITPIFEDADEDPISAVPLETTSPGSSIHGPVLLESAEMIAPWLQKMLADHDVVVDKQQWQCDLQAYLEEVHPIYPCLHTPSLCETFNELWEYPCRWPLLTLAEREHKRISVALFFLCLALGRCCNSSRMNDPTGLRSSGWSLYSVGMELLQDVMETSHAATRSVEMLQVLIARVEYLFRLDANQQAARVMAILVSMAHSMGLHRQRNFENLPAFQHQLYCRVWWVIYALDRRIAVESGQPFLIQDSNVDTALPLDLSEDWMVRYATRSETLAELRQEAAEETARDSPKSAIPYLMALVRYSRAAGKAWDILYGIKASNTSSHTMMEYVDMTLCKILDTVPEDLSYDPKIPYDVQFSMKPRWLVKQTFTLLTCCTYLRVLIRKPFTHNPKSSHGEDEEFESATACASIAAEILARQEKILDEVIKYSFALNHYVASCTMVMIGLVSREPCFKRRYGDLLVSSLQCLNMYCHKIWTSGKMVRLVSRLDRLVQRILNRDTAIQTLRQQQQHESISPHSYSAPHQQLTPRSDEQEALQVRQDVGQSIMDPCAMNSLRNDHGRGYKEQRPEGLFYAHGDRSSPKGVRDDVLATSWMAEPPPIDDRISCLMSDFDFEIMVNGGERFSTPGTDSRSRNFRGNDALTDRDFGNFKMGSLGLNGVIDLGGDLDTSLLYNPSILDMDLSGN